MSFHHTRSAFPPYANGLFNTVCVTGIPKSVSLQEIRQFFATTEGPCICCNIPNSVRNAVALRFSQPYVAQRVVLRYNNVDFKGFLLQVFPVVGNLLATVLPLLQQQYNLEQTRIYLQQKEQELLVKKQQHSAVSQPRFNTQPRSYPYNYKDRSQTIEKSGLKKQPLKQRSPERKIEKNHVVSGKDGGRHSHQSDGEDSKLLKDHENDECSDRRTGSSSPLDVSESIFYTTKSSRKSTTIEPDCGPKITMGRKLLSDSGSQETTRSSVSSMSSTLSERNCQIDESNAEISVITNRCKKDHMTQARYSHAGRGDDRCVRGEKRKITAQYDDHEQKRITRIKIESNGGEVKSSLPKQTSKSDNHSPLREVRASSRLTNTQQGCSAQNTRNIKNEISSDDRISPQLATGVKNDYRESEVINDSSNDGNKVQNSGVTTSIYEKTLMQIKQEPFHDIEITGSCSEVINQKTANTSLSENAKRVLEEVKTRLAAMRSLDTDEVLENVFSFTTGTQHTEASTRNEGKMPESSIANASLPTEKTLLNSEFAGKLHTKREPLVVSGNSRTNTPDMTMYTVGNHKNMDEDSIKINVNEGNKIEKLPLDMKGYRNEKGHFQIKQEKDTKWHSSQKQHQADDCWHSEYRDPYPRKETVFNQNPVMTTTEHRGSSNGFLFENKRQVFETEFNYVDNRSEEISTDRALTPMGSSDQVENTKETVSEGDNNSTLNYDSQFGGVIAENGDTYDEVFENDAEWERFDDTSNDHSQSELNISNLYTNNTEHGYDNHFRNYHNGVDHDEISSRFQREETDIHQPRTTTVDSRNRSGSLTPNIHEEVPPDHTAVTPTTYSAVTPCNSVSYATATPKTCEAATPDTYITYGAITSENSGAVPMTHRPHASATSNNGVDQRKHGSQMDGSSVRQWEGGRKNEKASQRKETRAMVANQLNTKHVGFGTEQKKFDKIIDKKRRQIEREYEQETTALLNVMKKLASKDLNMVDYLKSTFQDSLTELEKRLSNKLETLIDNDYQMFTRNRVQ